MKTTHLKIMRVEKKGFKERLNEALDKAGFPPKNRGRIQRLADMMDLTHRGAGKWLDGETTPPAKKCPVIAEKLHINSEWLISGKGNMVREEPLSVEPHAASVSAKEIPLYTLENWHNPYYTPAQTITCYTATVGKAFALKINTEALSPRFPLGSLVILDTGRIAKDGDFVLAQSNHFPTPQFRQLFMSEHQRSLEAHNPKFERVYMSPSDRILGVVVQAVSLFY